MEMMEKKHNKHTLDWYLKWVGSSVLLCAMIFRATGTYPLLDVSLSLIGCFFWLAVALIWHDRALLILNTVACVILTLGLISQLTNNSLGVALL